LDNYLVISIFCLLVAYAVTYLVS